jgi:hypothetical protein
MRTKRRAPEKFDGVKVTGMTVDELLQAADDKPTEDMIEQYRARKMATSPAARSALIKARRAAIGGAQ